MRRCWRALAAVGLVVVIAGCGSATVVDRAPSAPVYEGPLVVHLGRVPPTGSTGAAGRVVSCDHPGAVSGWAASSSRPHDSDVYRRPETALEKDLDVLTRGATEGYRVMRSEDDRILYTNEIDGVVKQASIVHRGPAVDGRTGWYVESWARCDWAELDPAAARALRLQLWSDADGDLVPTTTVVSHAGPEHCDWQDMTFLTLDGGLPWSEERGTTYLSDVGPEFADFVSGPYETGVDLPADARPTGYHRDGRELWRSADGKRVYVGDRGSVDVWPRASEQFGCA